MASRITKSITTFILVSFMMLTLFPALAHAQVPLPNEVPVGDGQQRVTQVQTLGNRIQDLAQKLFEWAKKIATAKLKQQLVKTIQDAVLGAVQGGGLPKFVTSYLALFDDLEFDIEQEYADSLQSVPLCSIFTDEVKNFFRQGVNSAPLGIGKGLIGDKLDCTLGEAIDFGRDVEDFVGGDFLSGGQEGLQAAWLPENNILSVFLTTYHDRENIKAEELSAIAQEISDASGFFGTKECKDGECLTKTPGATTKDIVSRSVTADIETIVNLDTLFEVAFSALQTVTARAIDEGITQVANVFDQAVIDQLRSSTDRGDTTIFEVAQRDLVQDINTAIEANQTIRQVIRDDVSQNQIFLNRLNDVKTDINNILTSRGGVGARTCRPLFGGTTVDILGLQTELQREIDRVTALLDPVNPNGLAAEEQASTDKITELEEARDAVEALENTDTGRTDLGVLKNDLVDDITGLFTNQAQQRRFKLEENRDLINNLLSRPKSGSNPGGFLVRLDDMRRCTQFN